MLETTRAYELDFLFPARDTAIGRSLAQNGEFARSVSDFLIDQAGEAPGTLLDVGANIGSVALPFAKAKPAWRVVAIEAHRGLAGLLAANALNNRCLNVEAIHAAAGAERGLADFPNPSLLGEANWGATGFHSQGLPTAPVAMLPLDEVAPDDTRLVKIDVEGYEPQVLQGAGRLIAEVRPVWFVETAQREPGRMVIQTLLDAGYSTHWFYAPFVTRRPLKGIPPADTTVGDANVVAVPSGMKLAWELPRARPEDAHWPTAASDYPYLARYGY